MFNDVGLTWKGETKVIRSGRVLKAIAVIEDVITIDQLASFKEASKIKLSNLSQAYGAVLRFAGFSVSDDDVYEGIIRGSSDQVALAQQAVMTLLTLLIPPVVADEKAAEKINEGNVQGARRSKSSKSATKLSSRA